MLWPHVLLFPNSPVVTSGTSWPHKCNSHKQGQPNLLTQAFCHGKSVFAGSTLSHRRGTEREVTHHGNSSFCVTLRELCAFPSLWALQISTHSSPSRGTPACGAWAVFPWEHLPGGAHACCLLPEFRLPPPLKKNPQASEPFEIATVALSFKADLQGNKCCHPDPTSCFLKKRKTEVREMFWEDPDYVFFFIFYSACSLCPN